MNNLEREYRDRVKDYLRPYGKDVVIALKKILSMDFDDDTVFIDLVLWLSAGFDDTMPLCTWPTNTNNEAASINPCPLSVIKISPFEYYDWDIEDFVEIEDCLKDVVARWLLDAWKVAGGPFCSLPCYFTVHDDLVTFDFKTEQWIESNPLLKQSS